VTQEQLERTDDLVLDDVDADDVLEAHVELLGADHDVRRATAERELPADQQDQHEEEDGPAPSPASRCAAPGRC
jgi:hypothetical protein